MFHVFAIIIDIKIACIPALMVSEGIVGGAWLRMAPLLTVCVCGVWADKMGKPGIVLVPAVNTAIPSAALGTGKLIVDMVVWVGWRWNKMGCVVREAR